ncbi:hypothetical protein CUMW_212860 [Citrus unshiu]|uniref:Uncharacterized protein n=1 Tax=Citrus unshiu TaxID=55188 RepID=A0A2H5QB42_CITUN|nr:hypothetical protein CUMW_212860 [Citrus unshiu]
MFRKMYNLGNIDSTEAGSMIQYIEDVFFKGSNPICQPLLPSQHLTNRLVRLDKGKNYVYSNRGLNPSDENSCLVHYIQGPKYIDLRVESFLQIFESKLYEITGD